MLLGAGKRNVQNEDKILAELSNTNYWKVLKKAMEEIARLYYGWDKPSDEMLVNKGAHLIIRDIIRKVEGAIESQE